MSKYKICYADPGWKFRVWDRATGMGRSAESHYRTMSLDEIKSLPVYNIMDKSSVLLLWAVSPSLPDAFDVINAWGFTYKTVAFNWVKLTPTRKKFHLGLGYYSRANTELCLLATRGKTIPRVSKAVRQLAIENERGRIVDSPLEIVPQTVFYPTVRHSQKPGIIRNRIVELFGDLPRIELFARERVPGWDAFGDEVDSDIDLFDSRWADSDG